LERDSKFSLVEDADGLCPEPVFLGEDWRGR